MRSISSYTKAVIPDWAREDARKQGGSIPETVFGIRDTYPGSTVNIAKDHLNGRKEWVYFDHSYFCRGWEKGNFRAVRNGLHLTELLDRPDDRLSRFKVEIEPWRRTGLEVVIIPPSAAQVNVYGCSDWLMRMQARLPEITDRPVVTKYGKENKLREFCSDAWAVVTYASVAGVEAALMGIPVFSTERCPSWPVNAGQIEDIETPEYSDARREWACSLSYASWNVEDMHKTKWTDYRYEVL